MSLTITNTFKKLRLPVLLVAVLAVAFAVGGCASLTGRESHPSGVSQDQLSAGGEPYFDVGPVTYQVQISRELNPFSTDDVQYFAGVKDAQTMPSGPNGDFWFGVFLWAKNQTSQTQPTASQFDIVDSGGTVYQPVALNSSINPYAWTSQSLNHNDIEPNADSTAGTGPNGGGLVLFKLPFSVYSNRPLTLEVYAPGATTPAKVDLDL